MREEEEAATEVLLGVCNLLPQEIGHALPALRLPLEVPLNSLEMCHIPHQSLCGSGAALPSPTSISLIHCQSCFPSAGTKSINQGSVFFFFFSVICVCVCICVPICVRTTVKFLVSFRSSHRIYFPLSFFPPSLHSFIPPPFESGALTGLELTK